MPADLIRCVFESSGIGIACVDLEWRFHYVNDDFARLLGPAKQAMHGLPVAQVVHPRFAVDLCRHLSRLAGGRGDRFVESVRTVRHDGRAIAGELTGVTLRDGGRPRLVVVLFAPDRAMPEELSGMAAPLTLTEAGARVLEGVAAGASTTWLATNLSLSRQGVDYHVGSLLRKLAAPNRPALVSKAYALGVLQPGSWPPKVTPGHIR